MERAHMPTVDIYLGPMRGAIGLLCESGAYLCSVCGYLSLSAKVLTSEAVTDARNVLRS